MIGQSRKGMGLATAGSVALGLALVLCAGSVRGQSFEPLRTSMPTPLPSWLPAIDPAFRSTLSQAIVSRNRAQPPTAATTASRPSSIPDTDSSGGPSLPAASPLPAPDPNPDPATAMPLLPVDKSLIPGRTIEPIDLPAALRLAGVRDLDIAIARQQLAQAVADLQKARALWLPSLFVGPTWYRADGQIQTLTGQVQNVNRSSLFVGGMAATANGFAAASPGTGYPPLNGMSSVLRFSDAIFEPLAARRVANAEQAGVQTSINNAMLEVAEAYFDLQQASGLLAIAREAAANALALSEITGAYVRAGQGLEADHRRALTELKHRRKDAQLASGQLLIASANLVRVLVLNPNIVIAPVEPAETIIRLIPDDVPLDNLVVQGLRQRPELAGAQEQVTAALVRWKQARMRPFIPSLGLTTAGGGFGGGANEFFGNFGTRIDIAASLFWELQNLGFGDLAIMHRRRAEHETAYLQLLKTEAQVAADVVAAYEFRQASNLQIKESSETVTEALASLRLNFINIRLGAELPGATRPIEVLQPIQALAQARIEYLESVLSYNRAQFRLNRAIGRP